MLRALAVVACLPGCSLILDFSDSAGVHDAAIDVPYTPAECMYMEPNDTPAQAAVIMPGVDMGPGAICKIAGDAGAVDYDYYKFTVAAGATKTTIVLTDGPMAGDLDLLLFDATGATTIGQSHNFTDTETLVCPSVSPACPALTPGSDYIFEVVPAQPANLNSYTFNVTFN